MVFQENVRCLVSAVRSPVTQHPQKGGPPSGCLPPLDCHDASKQVRGLDMRPLYRSVRECDRVPFSPSASVGDVSSLMLMLAFSKLFATL